MLTKINHLPNYNIYTTGKDIKDLNNKTLEKNSYLEILLYSLKFNDVKIYKNNIPVLKEGVLDIIDSFIKKIPTFQNKNISNYEFQFYLNIADILCYYTTEKLVRLLFQKVPQIFEPHLTYTYNYSTNYTLVRSSGYAKNLDIVKFLVVELGHSFYNNLKDYEISKLNRNDRETLKLIMSRDNINNYIYDDSNLIHFIADSELSIFVIKQIIDFQLEDKSVVSKKYTLLHNIFTHYLLREDDRVIKFMLNNSYMIDNIFKFVDTSIFSDYLYDTLYEHIKIKHQSNLKLRLKKVNIIKYIVQYFKNHTTKFEDLKRIIFLNDIYYENYSIFVCLAKYPNIIPVLNILELQDFNTINNGYEFFVNLYRYGTFETVKYLKHNFVNFLNQNEDNISHKILTNSFCNRDRRVCIFLLDLIKQNFMDDYNCIYSSQDLEKIDFRFFRIENLSNDNKIKKLKIINKHFQNEIIFILGIQELQYISNLELKKWFYKKFSNNNFKMFETYRVLKIFNTVINEYNFDFLLYFLKNINSEKINYWILVKQCLEKNFLFLDPFVQELLKYCPPLKFQKSEIKRDILFNLKNFSDTVVQYTYRKILKNNSAIKPYIFKIETQESHNNLIRYFIDQECDIYNYKLFGYDSVLTNYINYKPKLFKALIFNNISFKPIVEIHEKKKNYFWPNNLEKSWLSLYYLIKKLEFKIWYRNKKNHNYKFKSTMIDLISRPPSNKPVLKKGGVLFNRDLDEMDLMLDEERIEFINAQHIKPLELINLVESEEIFVFSQKVDGLLHKNIDKSIIYPPIEDENLSYKILDAEYVKELDLYFIFGIRSYQNYNTSVLEDFNELRNEHYIARHTKYSDLVISQSDSSKDIKEKLEQEMKDIYKFLLLTKNHKKRWWPKTFYHILGDSKRKLEVLNIIQDFQDIVFNQLSSEIYSGGYQMKNYILKDTIMMDGLIVMLNSNKQQIFKLKPKQFMSADLKINNEIWRCYWNNNNNIKWEPFEKRKDKHFPNNKNIIQELEVFHKHPWTPISLIPYLNNNNFYQINKEKDFYTSQFVSNCKKFTNKILGPIYNNIIHKNKYGKQNILDLGCGYFNNKLWHKSDIHIDGLDIDYKLVQNKPKYKNKRFFIQDISKKWNCESNLLNHYYNSNFMFQDLTKYNYIFSLMSIHNSFQNNEGIYNLLDEINKHTLIGSKMIISFLDKEILFQNKDTLYFPDGSFMSKKQSNELLYYFSWRHKKPIREPLISLQDLQNNFVKYNWKLDNIYRNNITEENPWLDVSRSLSVAIFEKK